MIRREGVLEIEANGIYTSIAPRNQEIGQVNHRPRQQDDGDLGFVNVYMRKIQTTVLFTTLEEPPQLIKLSLATTALNAELLLNDRIAVRILERYIEAQYESDTFRNTHYKDL